VAQVLPSWQDVKSFLQAALSWILGAATISNVLARITLVIVVVSFVLIWQEATRDVVIVEPIAVPKALAESGYTPEVAGDRLLDALDAVQKPAGELQRSVVDEANAANSILAHTVAARDEMPDFVVPQIGLSLKAIVSLVRSVAHFNNGTVISGELVFRDQYALRVRVDGKEVFTSGFDSSNPDDLLDRAALSILTKIWPARGATVLYRTDPDQALRDADDIIATLAKSDPNVADAYILKGEDAAQHDDLAEAVKWFRKAIGLNPKASSFYNHLGLALQRQGHFNDALAQFRHVVHLNPKSAAGYNNIGAALVQLAQLDGEPDKSRLDQARKSYEHAIELKPHDVGAHNNLGLVWNLLKKREDAINEFALVTKIDPNYLYGHWNLAANLSDQKQFDQALEEYRRALDCTEVARDLALLHIHIGNTLKARGAAGDLDAAIGEYRLAVDADSSLAWTHNSLGEALRDLGKFDEAIAEFRAALQLDDADKSATKAAKENLDEAKAKARELGALKEEAQAEK